MEYRRLGQSDLQVSALSLGILSMVGGGSWGPQDDEEAARIIDTAFDAGVNFFDTAESYADGYSETVLGRVLQNRRSEVVLASKVSSENLGARDLIRACEGSLRRLATDYLDLYYIHWPNPSIPLEETMGALERLKEQGKIRVAGCSNFGSKDMEKLLRHGRVEANQLPYSLLWRPVEFEIMDFCAEQDIGIACYSPLAQGLLTGKYRTPQDVPDERAKNRLFSSQRPYAEHGGPGVEEEMFEAIRKLEVLSGQWGLTMTQAVLQWTLGRRAIASVIVGCRTCSQLEQSLAALQAELPAGGEKQLEALTENIKKALGPNPDMWSKEDQSRYDRYPD